MLDDALLDALALLLLDDEPPEGGVMTTGVPAVLDDETLPLDEPDDGAGLCTTGVVLDELAALNVLAAALLVEADELSGAEELEEVGELDALAGPVCACAAGIAASVEPPHATTSAAVSIPVMSAKAAGKRIGHPPWIGAADVANDDPRCAPATAESHCCGASCRLRNGMTFAPRSAASRLRSASNSFAIGGPARCTASPRRPHARHRRREASSTGRKSPWPSSMSRARSSHRERPHWQAACSRYPCSACCRTVST